MKECDMQEDQCAMKNKPFFALTGCKSESIPFDKTEHIFYYNITVKWLMDFNTNGF